MPRAQKLYFVRFWLVTETSGEFVQIAERLKSLKNRKSGSVLETTKLIRHIQFMPMQLSQHDYQSIKMRETAGLDNITKSWSELDDTTWFKLYDCYKKMPESPWAIIGTLVCPVDGRCKIPIHEAAEDAFLGFMDDLSSTFFITWTQHGPVTDGMRAHLLPREQVRKPTVAYRRVATSIGPKVTARC
jgi:hypothetical protein